MAAKECGKIEITRLFIPLAVIEKASRNYLFLV
jgi:hypothetical protein